MRAQTGSQSFNDSRPHQIACPSGSYVEHASGHCDSKPCASVGSDWLASSAPSGGGEHQNITAATSRSMCFERSDRFPGRQTTQCNLPNPQGSKWIDPKCSKMRCKRLVTRSRRGTPCPVHACAGYAPQALPAKRAEHARRPALLAHVHPTTASQPRAPQRFGQDTVARHPADAPAGIV